MAESLKQLEQNIQSSFGYVKKDLLMVNDAISDLHDKIQHLSLNHANLLEKIQEIEDQVKPKSKKKSKKKPKKKSKKKKTTKKSSPKKKVVKTEEITYS